MNTTEQTFQQQLPFRRLATAESRETAVFSHYYLAGLLLIFLLLGAVYSLATPPFEAPDESFHFFFVQYVATTGQLPIQRVGQRGPYEQEGSQPPLYYVLGAVLIRGIDTADASQYTWENPQTAMGHPAVVGNANRYIHDSGREAFPWTGTALAVHLLRTLSLLFGAMTVWITYLTARRVFAQLGPESSSSTRSTARRPMQCSDPRIEWCALATALLVAFTPQFLFVSSAVNNDSLITLLSVLGLYLLVRIAQGDTGWRVIVGLGGVTGLAMLAKLGGVLLLGLAAVALCMAGWQQLRAGDPARGVWTRTMARLAVVILIALTIAGWWYLRNQILYGDWTGLSAMHPGVKGRKLSKFLQGAAGEMYGLWLSYWGLFGWFSILAPDAVYFIFHLLALVSLAGWGWTMGHWLVRRWRSSGRPAPSPVLSSHVAVLGLLVLWLSLIFVALVRWSLFVKGSQGRLLFPAISAVAILLVVGLRSWVPATKPWLLPAILTTVLLPIAVIMPPFIIQPAYATPSLTTLDQLPPELPRVDRQYGDGVQLLAIQVEPPDVVPGQLVDVTLYWRAMQPITENPLMFIHVLGRNLRRIANLDSYPGWGKFPTGLWPAGPVIVDRYRLLIAPDAEVPTLGRVEVGFQVTNYTWPIRDVNHQIVPPPAPVAQVRVHNSVIVPEATPLAVLADVIRLERSAVEPVAVQPGSPITLSLTWRAQQPPKEDWQVFVHVLDPAGHPVAQADGPPLQGDYPTSAWGSGDVIHDDYRIQIPATVAAGEYSIQVGMYNLVDGQRAAAVNASGQAWPDNSIPVSSLSVHEHQ